MGTVEVASHEDYAEASTRESGMLEDLDLGHTHRRRLDSTS